MTTKPIIGRRCAPAGPRGYSLWRGWLPKGAIRAGLLLATTALLAALARADTLTTTDGKVFEGKIIERTSGGVTFEIVSKGMRAQRFFATSQIAKLEVGVSPEEQRRQAYEAKKKTLDLSAAEGWHQLGLWCAEQRMYEEAVEAFKQSIARDEGYLVKSTLAQARMEVGRDRLRTARDLLTSLIAARPDDDDAKAELARVQQRMNAELTRLFETGRAAYQRADHPTALGAFRRVALEADAALLANLARTLAQKNEPSLAEMLITCRLSDALVDRSGTFETVTPLEKPLLLTRLQGMVQAGARASEAAAGAIAAKTGGEMSERLAAAQRELKALERLENLATVGQTLAKELKNQQTAVEFVTMAHNLANARARIALLWVETLEAAAREALATLSDDTAAFERRVKAADAAHDRIQEGLAALKTLAAKAASLPDTTEAGIAALRRRFEELERQVRGQRDHLKRIETALERGLRAYERREYDDAVLWLSRMVKEANEREGRGLEDIVKRRTGEHLVDLMVEARIRQARKAGRFREATAYDRGALDRELSRRASDAFVRATQALREARNAAPGSNERRAAARRAINHGEEAVFYLRGRREIGVDLTRREHQRILDDIDDMEGVVRQARQLLLTG